MLESCERDQIDIETPREDTATTHACNHRNTIVTRLLCCAGASVCRDGKNGVGAVQKLGRVLEGGPEGSWDEQGVGTRHVIHHEGALWMLYEAVSSHIGCCMFTYLPL